MKNTPNFNKLTLSALALAVSLAACTTERSNQQSKAAELEESQPRQEIAVQKQPVRLGKARSQDQAMMTAGALHATSFPAPEGLMPVMDNQNRENYAHFDDNPIKKVSEQAVSTFSVDVDTAAYSNVRRMILREGRLPPSAAVKAEEFINYFNYQYDAPLNTEAPFSINTEVAPSPWNANTHLVQIGLKGFEPQLEQRPASNLVFLIDVSGSMQSPYKLHLVKQSLRMLVKQMNKNDTLSLVVYAGAAGVVLTPTSGDQQATIMNAIDGLSAGGSTNGGAGIELAYKMAQQSFIKGGINRVLIASDGDMNVGTVNHEALKDLIKQKRQSGIALSTLGFGSGNYNYALMEELADVGNGNATYIDSLKEAHKVLVREMQSTLLTIAKDVKIQVEFNPALVAEYRLIGYENRLLKREDFRNDKVDAGDIGAGHTVTALYEIALTNSGGEKLPELRYGDNKTPSKSSHQSELAFVKLRYKQPDGEQSSELSRGILRNSVHDNFNQASQNLQFAAATAGFAQILRGGEHTGDWSYEQALQLTRQAKGNDPHGYRAELGTLIELAQSFEQSPSNPHENATELSQR